MKTRFDPQGCLPCLEEFQHSAQNDISHSCNVMRKLPVDVIFYFFFFFFLLQVVRFTTQGYGD